MGWQRFLLKLGAMFLAVLLPFVLVAPAQAAPKPKVSIKQSATSVAPGKTVTFKGSVTKSSKKATISLQRLESGSWVTIATTKVTSKRKYSIKARVPAGTYKYRMRVTGNKKIASAVSKTKKVTGTFQRSVNPAMIGETFTLKAQLPDPVSRPVLVQRSLSGSWVTVRSLDSASTGTVTASLAFSGGATVRFHAPAVTVGETEYPAWTSASTAITVVAWDRVAANKILADINKYRKKKKKKALKLHMHNSTVAYNWSKHMHDAEVFEHNPKYSKQITAKWKRAGENIAAGQTVDTVFEAWRKSKSHRKNMLGDYTHIGIGVYTGPNGYKRYFTTVLAKY